ncbi:MAG: DUF4129 domain-containing protein [Actinobacteria bacterium]|nr:DUF4129 domain-containing protein [Actinomycetota bacterium]
MRRFLACLAAALVVVAASPGAAGAAEATAQEVRSLAREASFDDAALGHLKTIDEVDGRPVDFDRLLHGATGEEIEQRVESFLQAPAVPPRTRDPGAERAEARDILSQDRYRPDDIPRPFRGVLEWIAARLEPVANVIDGIYGWITDVFSFLVRRTPGGAATIWTIIGFVVVAAVAALTKTVVERRGAARAQRAAAGDLIRSDDPRELERRAAAARARGEHDLAVRLLFRAGLLRLARARVIPPRDSLTTGQIRRLLRSPEFDRIGTSFDEIAYGRRPATDADSRAARDAWSELLQTRSG